jgi:zinc finger-containing ubiquitin peptidase 1
MRENQQSHQSACPFCGWAATSGEYEMLLVSCSRKQTRSGQMQAEFRNKHIETHHAESQSPFVVSEDLVSTEQDVQSEDQYAECPVDGCGEIILVPEMDEHLELHVEERELEGDPVKQSCPSPVGSAIAGSSKVTKTHTPCTTEKGATTAGKRNAAIQQWKRLFSSSREVATKTEKESHQKSSQQERRRLGVCYNSREIHISLNAHPPQKAELGRYAHEKAMPDWLASLLRKEGEVKAAGTSVKISPSLPLNEDADD